MSLLPIAQISGFSPPAWVISARVVDLWRAPVRDGGQGLKIFTIDLMDSQGDMIRAKFWDEAANKWDKILQKGKVYKFGKGRVNVANKKYNNLQHYYELTFDSNSEISEAAEDEAVNIKEAPSMPQMKFTKLRDIYQSTRPLPYITDVMCVIKSSKAADTVNVKTKDATVSRRELVLVDDSEYELVITLWDAAVELLEPIMTEEPCVVAISGLQIREWRGKTGQSTRMTKLYAANPTDEGSNLLRWYNENSKSVEFRTMQERVGDAQGTGPEIVSLSEAFDILQDFHGDQKVVEVQDLQVSKFHFRSKTDDLISVYTACSTCKRRLIASDNEYRCENCDAVVEPAYRYSVMAIFSDTTGSRFWGRVYHDACGSMVPHTAASIQEDVKGAGRITNKVKSAFEIESIWKRYTIRFFLKNENINGVPRKGASIALLRPLDYPQRATTMLQELKKWTHSEPRRKRGLTKTETTSSPVKKKLWNDDGVEEKEVEA
eukprot:GHVO01034557.1.p1 GENE.GHVO01034557.1~~GHVO01034557.1.p1  ORF type:complete len:490 (-),score=79.35 GHVO01034557.1:147-1616(-)